jgi:hypothetical protein
LWAIVLGTVGIIVYMEMCGRIAVVAHDRSSQWCAPNLGFRFGLFVLGITSTSWENDLPVQLDAGCRETTMSKRLNVPVHHRVKSCRGGSGRNEGACSWGHWEVCRTESPCWRLGGHESGARRESPVEA